MGNISKANLLDKDIRLLEPKATRYLVAVGNPKELYISISNGIKELNNIKNKIKDGAEILYQSPNANSNLQTLLQASRYSANEIDKTNTTKNHFKSQYTAHNTSPQTPNKNKDLER